MSRRTRISRKARHKLKQRERKQQRRLEQLKLFLTLSVVANLLLVGTAGILALERTPDSETRVAGFPATMDPANFENQTRESYQVARDIPAVLDGIFCYCYCEENHDHRSLLECYFTEHAATCGKCQGEALRAQELWDEGLSILHISDKIDEEYGGKSLDRGP